jgi:hypothetical protein
MLRTVLIGMAGAGLLAACATSPQVSDPVARNAITSTPPGPSTCLHTGTRIRLEEGECANVSGRAYSRSDIERTGALTVDEALRMLDPAIYR